MISINPYEIIFQIINFGILYWLLKKFLAKPLATFLESRRQLIKQNIESTETNRKQSEDLLNQQKQTLKEAQVEAQAIRKKAEESAQKELASVIEDGRKSAQNLIEQAKTDIDLQANNAKQALLKSVADLTVAVVQKFVSTDVSSEDKKKTIDRLVSEVASK